jgi:hypothetical protein
MFRRTRGFSIWSTSARTNFCKRFRPLFETLECRRVLAANITVNSTLDTNARDSVVTLREAISISNRTLLFADLSAAEKALITGTSTNSDADTIQFNIPVSDAGHVYYKDDGVAGSVTLANVMSTIAASDASIGDIDPDWAQSWFTIRPTTALPSTVDPVTIDGYTQSGASANTNAVGQGLNTVLKIEIDGTNAGEVVGNIGVAQGSGTIIRGMALNRAVGAEIALYSVSSNAVVTGNYIGTDISGTRAFALPAPSNPSSAALSSGVYAEVPGNTIGGTTAAARNLISGNTLVSSGLRSAILIRGGFSAPTTVQGNIIGADRTGTHVLGNIGAGVFLDSPNSVIGGATVSAGNVISGNQTVSINFGSLNAVGALIQNNKLGTDPTGTLAVGTTGGISFINTASNNRILDNTIAFGTGIRMTSGSTGNLISRNSIFSNTGLGIDLNNDGPTANDVPPASAPPDQDNGANKLQNYPIITSLSDLAPGTRIQGTLASTPSANFRLEFFASADRDESNNNFAEGQTYLGFVDVSTNSSGNATFSVDLAALPAGQPYVTATATDTTNPGSGPANNTSEFSAVAVLGGVSFVVTNTNDSGPGSLREAIVNANATSGTQTITFNIPATDARHFYYTDDGVAGEVSLDHIATTTAVDDSAIVGIDPDWAHSWFSIQPTSDLPKIVDTVVIDGYSQAGSSVNTLPALQALNTVLKVELDGESVSGDGLSIGTDLDNATELKDASGSAVRGLAINRFGGDGIELSTLDGQNVIAGNFIGTDVSGILGLGNLETGIYVNIENESLIGGTATQVRNLIAGNFGDGIQIFGSSDVRVQGNLIGTSRVLAANIGNGGDGIFIVDSPFIGVGGVEAGAGNVIVYGGPIFTLLRANAPNVQQPAAGHNGVTIATSKNDYFATSHCKDEWGDYSAAVAHEGADSEEASDAWDEYEKCVRASIAVGIVSGWIWGTKFKPYFPNPQSNLQSIAAAPAGFPIDLGGNGVTPNDNGDNDDGPNHGQNAPVLISAQSTTSTVVDGTYNGAGRVTVRIEFFSSATLDAAGHGPGENYLGFVDVLTNSAGNSSFTFNSPTLVPAGQFVTATATLLVPDYDVINQPLIPFVTSEFSAGVAVGDSPAAAQVTVLGAERGSDVKPRVNVLDAKTGAFISSFLAYETSFHGGVRVATGDLTGDGVPEIITAPGAGRAGLVKVFDLAGNELTGFQTTPYPSSFKGGVFVAVADVNGDGRLDLITTPDKGRAAEVRVYFNRFNSNPGDPFTSAPQRKFLALGDTYTGGVTVAAGDLTGDGKAEVVIGNRPGRSPIVRAFNLAAFSQASTLKLAPRLFEFVPFKSTDRGGLSVAVGNLRNDTRAEILVGNGTGGQIQLFNPDGTRFKTINAYTDSSKNAPIYVAAKDIDSDDSGDLYAEVLASQGVSGSSKRLKSFQPDATAIDNVLQGDFDFRHGFFVA